MASPFTVIVPFRNGQAHLGALLASIPAHIPILIVDDVSDSPLPPPRQPNVKVTRLAERGYFSGAVNAGIAATRGDVLVLNQDVSFVNEQWLGWLLEHRARYALLGDGVFNHPFLPLGYVQGTFMYMRRDALDAVGSLNAEEYPLWGATAEWQVRAARRGYHAHPVDMRTFGMVHARGAARFGSSIQATLEAQPSEYRHFIQTPPLVSVVITNYNYGRFLKDAVNSLIGGDTCLGAMTGQTLASFEVLLVDDGSKDDSAVIARALADPRLGVKFIQRVNGGSAAAANTGIAQALGKYITVLDADDMMEPARLERMVVLARQHPHRVVYDDLFWMQPTKEGAWLRSVAYELSPYDFDKMLTRNAMHKGILFEKKAWEEVGGYPETMREGREDWAFNIALGAKGYCGVHLKEPLYIYRRHESNRTRSNTTPEWREYHMEQLNRLFPNLYAGERPMGCCGNKTNGSAPSAQAARAARGLVLGGNEMAVGAQGMVLMEYLLNRAGSAMYYGAVTHAQYTFGGSRKQGYVDARDVPAMLELREGRMPAFRVKTEAPPQPVVAQANAVPEPEMIPAEPPLEEREAEGEDVEEEEAEVEAQPARRTPAKKSTAKTTAKKKRA